MNQVAKLEIRKYYQQTIVFTVKLEKPEKSQSSEGRKDAKTCIWREQFMYENNPGVLTWVENILTRSGGKVSAQHLFSQMIHLAGNQAGKYI